MAQTFRTRQRTWSCDEGVHPDTQSPTLEADWEPAGDWRVVGFAICCGAEVPVIKFGWVQDLRLITP